MADWSGQHDAAQPDASGGAAGRATAAWAGRRAALLEAMVAEVREAMAITTPRLDRPEPMILHANAAFTRLAASEGADLTGRSLDVLKPAGGRIEAFEPFHAAMLDAAEQEGELRVIAADGTARTLAWTTRPLKPDAEGPVYSLARLEDVTESARHRDDAIRARAIADVIAAHVEALVYMIDPEGTVILPAGQSHKALQPLAASTGELAGEGTALRRWVHPEDQDAFDTELHRLAMLAPGGTTRRVLRVRGQVPGERGEHAEGGDEADCRCIEYSHTALTGPPPLQGWVLGLAADRTQWQQAQRQFRKAARIASLGTLMTGIGHELNDPLSSILASAGLAESMLDSPDAGEQLRPVLQQISEEAARCGRVVSGLLAFTRGDASRRGPVRLNEVAMYAMHLTRNFAEAHHGKVYLDCPAELPPVQASALEVQQSLVHLISRALQAGADEVWVRMAPDQATERIAIHVDDDGPPIPASRIEQVRSGVISEDADVLPLSVVCAIAEDHGGSLQIRRLDDGRTRIRFDLAPAGPDDD